MQIDSKSIPINAIAALTEFLSFTVPDNGHSAGAYTRL
jgi:hypothetical protein